MAILDDTLLLAKKILVTVIIYLVPITILVGGLLLTQCLLNDEEVVTSVNRETPINPQNP